MTTPHPPGFSWPLLTDLYELTMACAYWSSARADHQAVFAASFRTQPFQGGYCIAAGLAPAIEYLENLHFSEDDLAYLATLTGNDHQPLFPQPFLDHLRDFQFACDVDAIPEGTAVFPHEPLVRVRGPILHCQLVETALLTLLNFQTLIATKAARVCRAAKGDPVLEFGLRRAQGVDGGLAASRAAYLGGCAGTSNLLAGKRFGIPVGGTHAHSWVMSFDSELESFAAYARAMPNNCTFLVDTYDTLEGVRHATEIGQLLRAQGHQLAGIRLDSGDLAYLSIEARKILDHAGFPHAKILASNDLDEHLIESLKQQGARIAVWGVGTKLVTAYDHPALGGVYKLTAMQDETGAWQPKIKLSEVSAKVSIPGTLQVRRYRDGAYFAADAIYDEPTGIPESPTLIDPADPIRRKHIPQNSPHEDLLTPIFRQGKRVYDPPPLESIRARAQDQLNALHPTILRLENPHEYPVGLEERLYNLRMTLVTQARGELRR